MNNIVAMKPQGSVRDYTPTQLGLMKRTVAKDCDANEFDLYMEVARRVGLDPFRKQIYAIVTNKGKKDKRQLVIVTGIDGYRAVANRSGRYRPDEDEPEIHYSDALKDPASNPLGIEKAVARVFKQDQDGQWHPIKAAAYWDEFAPLIENGRMKDSGEVWEDSGRPKMEFVGDGTFRLDPRKSNWIKMGRVMISKCAEAQALRKGWPEDLSGVYVQEEVDQQMIDVTPSEAIAREEEERRLAMVNAKGATAFQFAAGDPLEYVPHGQIADRIMAFLNDAESPTQVDVWRRVNANALREFWAKNKADALEIKAAIERRISDLERSETT